MPKLTTDTPEIRSMRGLHIYHAGMSNCSMRVRLLAQEKALSWTSHELNLGKGENLTPEYLAINPKGLVPAIVHDGRVVTESNDILFYLEETFPEPGFSPAMQDERENMRAWAQRSADLHIKAMKTYMYGTMGGSKGASVMEHYREIQSDPELVEFHQKATDACHQSVAPLHETLATPEEERQPSFREFSANRST